MNHDTAYLIPLKGSPDAAYPEATTWWPTEVDWQVGLLQAGAVRYRRQHVSPWIQAPDRPRYRLGIWERSGA